MGLREPRHRDSKAVVPRLARWFRGMGAIVAVVAGFAIFVGDPVQVRWVGGMVLAFLLGWFLAAAAYDDDQ